MPSFTIEGIDNQFAVSTGSNVDSTANSSTFDNPPQGSKDLVITTHANDPDPRLFELGDTYDVAWGGQGGGGTMLNAVVVRTDDAPGGGGIIVFEGIDDNGDPAQVIWTPDFDLEGWYNDNYNPSNEPQFYTEDINSGYTHSYICFGYETRIATPDGPVKAGRLAAGDRVRTLDGMDAAVRWVGARMGPGTGLRAPVVFDPGSIGNKHQLRLSQQHRVLLCSPNLELYYGFNEALVPAKAMVNGNDIRMQECDSISYVHILLDRHEILLAEAAKCESLFLGPQSVLALEHYSIGCKSNANAIPAIRHRQTARPVLTLTEARRFFQFMGKSVAPPTTRIGG